MLSLQLFRIYQDIKLFEEIDDDDMTTTNSDEENSTNKSDTDEEIEAITPSSIRL